jgi:hypothetical protein
MKGYEWKTDKVARYLVPVGSLPPYQLAALGAVYEPRHDGTWTMISAPGWLIDSGTKMRFATEDAAKHMAERMLASWNAKHL